jgi:hypothetical protein
LQEGVTEVKKCGKATGLTSGKVDIISSPAVVEYDDRKSHKLHNLIRIKSSDPNNRFSSPGDSGSLVVDSSNRAVGILVAGTLDGAYSYAIPIDSVLNQFNLSLNPKSV